MLSRELSGITEAAEGWFKKNARDLPWRNDRTPFRVWVSEIMLQQTQVSKVIDYFNRFMGRFKTVADLAPAPEDEVLSYWTGLGYYSRCRNLHRAAKEIVSLHGGEFPTDAEKIRSLPGIGSYTAGAIRSFAFNQVASVVDGNIARVLARLFADSIAFQTPAGKKHFEALSLELAQQASQPGLFHEGLMEIGAVVCKPRAPLCEVCPLSAHCEAFKTGTQEIFPVQTKKAKRTELHAVFAVIGNDEYVWLERNESSRLLKNLYAPPHVFIEKPEDAHKKFEQLLRQLSCQNGKSVMPAEAGIQGNCANPDKMDASLRWHDKTCLRWDDKAFKKITVIRQLTHRIFHLHGYVMKSNPSEIPHANWVKRSELSKVGLSSAVKVLLQKAQLQKVQLQKVQLLTVLCLLVASACVSQKESLRQKQQVTGGVAVPEDNSVKAEVDPLRERLVKLALAAVGKKTIKANGVSFRRDCSGSVRGIFAQAGLTLQGAAARKYQSDAETLFDYAEETGITSLKDPQAGDLIFFENTYDFNRNGKFDDGISHVGIVTRVLEDGNVQYVHFSRGRIIESELRDIIRRPRRRAKSKTGFELFAGYGKFALSDLVDERV